MAVDQGKSELAVISADFFDARGGLRMADDENRQYFIPPDLALAEQVLVQLGRFSSKAAGNAGSAAVADWRHA